MAAIHSFSTTFNKNGNITISFYEGPKERRIILVGSTPAHCDYVTYYHFTDEEGKGKAFHNDSRVTNDAFSLLRKDYLFKKHPNNGSIFYPKAK